MMDFLKSHPGITREEYMWGMTVPQVVLASCDFAHLLYLKDRKRRRNGKRKSSSRGGRRYDNLASFVGDLGLPKINGKQK